MSPISSLVTNISVKSIVYEVLGGDASDEQGQVLHFLFLIGVSDHKCKAFVKDVVLLPGSTQDEPFLLELAMCQLYNRLHLGFLDPMGLGEAQSFKLGHPSISFQFERRQVD